MKLQVTGCSHHDVPLALRERLAFQGEQVPTALASLQQRFPTSELVLLSTCNRVEIYCAAQGAAAPPTHHELVSFLAQFHGLDEEQVFEALFERTGEDAVRHLFMVAASLDSMVIGEAQILSQVKQAFQLARQHQTIGPLLQMAFEAAHRVAKRVQTETHIHRRRVSIPSVAVSDFACRLFDHFNDKRALVIGAGEMAEETVRYLIDEGVRTIRVVNRNPERAAELSRRLGGEPAEWERLAEELVLADLVVSTTGATEPIVTSGMYAGIDYARAQRPLFILDLAVPRDFEEAVGKYHNVYLYCIDDLQAVCESNRKARQKEWPKAERIIEDETARFMTNWYHRETAPTVRRLKERADEVKESELRRLLHRLDALEPRQRQEIERSFDRLVNKLLHPPLESLRQESAQGTPHGLLDALKRLFQISE